MKTTSVSASRRRHPTAGWPPPGDDLRSRVAQALELCGCPHPGVAAAVLEVRGGSGLDREVFARRAGVDLDLLTRAERGQLPRDALPGALRRMVPA